MIYTVTLNPAIDKTADIANFSIDRVNRIQELRWDAGGKGINVSKAIRALDGTSCAICLLGGNAGAWIHQQLIDLGINAVAHEVPGETRTNLKVLDGVHGTKTDINEPGPEVPIETIAGVLTDLLARVKPNDIVVLAGDLTFGAPSNTYAHWISALKEKGCKVFLDSHGESLECGVAAVPFLIKPNVDAFSGLTKRHFDSTQDMAEAACTLAGSGISHVVITLGKEGALFVSADEAWLARAPDVRVGSTVGSGDAVVAACAYGEEVGLADEGIMRLAMAAGAACAMQPGTKVAPRDLIDSLVSEVTLTRLI
ncbi:MAG: 1-phosphofructokinase family hexose kinase [Atopobiaceae bacterium]|jgi:1-phosphofructokinase